MHMFGPPTMAYMCLPLPLWDFRSASSCRFRELSAKKQFCRVRQRSIVLKNLYEIAVQECQMSSLSFSAIVTLESALALLSESLENLKAAGSVEVAQLSEQLRVAAESAGKVRESVLSKMPETSPQSRQELDALVEKIRETLEARRVEQQRSRLLALAAELERGTVVHRRALRVSEVKQLREQAVTELRAHAQSEAPPTLPGPAAPQWVEWACGLQEPHDAECLQLLQSGFASSRPFRSELGTQLVARCRIARHRDSAGSGHIARHETIPAVEQRNKLTRRRRLRPRFFLQSKPMQQMPLNHRDEKTSHRFGICGFKRRPRAAVRRMLFRNRAKKNVNKYWRASVLGSTA